jgi:hypothetical protein
MARKEKKYHFIYKTTNNLNKRYYYGMHSTDNLDDGYLGSGTYLRRAIKKYGKENFTIEILQFCKSREELKSLESKIVTLQEVANVECMNLRVGGSGPIRNYGYVMTTEIREKISKNHAKYWLGKTRDDGFRQKMSEVNIGKKLSDKTKQKISKALSGKYVGEKSSMHGRTGLLKPFYNKTHSEETKIKIRQKRKKQIITEETKQKISENHKKPIIQFSITGQFIREYTSRNEAAMELNINPTMISNHIVGRKKSAGGFLWKYK